MGGLFGGHKQSKPKPAPAAPVAPPQAPNTNGAIAGVSQNYGTGNLLGGTSQIARGSFLGS